MPIVVFTVLVVLLLSIMLRIRAGLTGDIDGLPIDKGRAKFSAFLTFMAIVPGFAGVILLVMFMLDAMIAVVAVS